MAEHESHQRRPDSVYGIGEEPDPRFSMANERTSLAWMRTALALVAGGVALISLATLAAMPQVGSAGRSGRVRRWRRTGGPRRPELGQGRAGPSPAAATAFPRSLAILAGGVVLLAAFTLVLAVVEVAQP